MFTQLWTAVSIAALSAPALAQSAQRQAGLPYVRAPRPAPELRVEDSLATWNEPPLPRVGEVLRVNAMPDSSVDAATGFHRENGWVGRDHIVWGNASGGTLPYSWTLSFGDGSAPVGGTAATAADARYIRARHAYATQGPKLAVLTVTDALGASDSDVVRIDVGLEGIHTKVEAAIADGLRYLYLIQYASGAFPVFRNGADGLIATAFQLRGHSKYNDPDEDIYADTLAAYWDYIWGRTGQFAISAAADANGNGYGVYFSGYTDWGGYQQGIMALALASIHPCRDLSEALPSGTEAGRSLFDLLQDMIELIAHAQTDTGVGRGGWRYGLLTSNYGSSDNSVVQWPVLAMIAAEELGVTLPDFVKPELQMWTSYSQDASGCFGYTSVGYFNNIAKTGSGLIQLGWLGYPFTSPQVQDAISCVAARWASATDVLNYREQFNNNLYAMYALKKGMELFLGASPGADMIGPHDWQDEYDKTLVDDPSSLYDGVGGVPFSTDGMEQDISGNDLNDGRWLGDFWFGNYGGVGANTAAAILILTSGVIDLVPVPLCLAFPDSAGPGDPITFDAGASYHQSPCHRIVEYAWDFDDSDGIDFDPPEAQGLVTTTSYSLAPGETSRVFGATLRVTDDDDPPRQRTIRCPVTISIGQNHPPIALPGGPYTACVGEEILLDGSASYDPDEDEGDSVVAYHWDLDGDGLYDDFDGPSTAVVFPGLYDGFVSLQVEDSHGALSGNANARVRVYTALGDLTTGPGDLVVEEDAGCLTGVMVCVRGTYRVLSDDPDFVVPAARVDFYLDDPNLPANLIASFTDHDLVDGMEIVHTACFVRPDANPHSVVMVVDPNQAVNECVETDNRVTLDILCDSCLDENGRPRTLTALTLQYTADKCGASAHSQDHASVACRDLLLGPLFDEVLVIARIKPCPGFGSKTWLTDPEPSEPGLWSRITRRDERFILYAEDLGLPAFPETTYFCIVERITGKHLQLLSMRTACDAPLYDGDQFGSLRVISSLGAPLIVSEPPLTAFVGIGYAYAVVAEDSGGEPEFEFSLPVAPLGMTVDPVLGKVLWTPSPSQAGAHPVVVRVVNRHGRSDEQAYSLVVSDSP